MPYIAPDRRPALDTAIGTLAGHICTAGEANYAITQLLRRAFAPTSYAQFNEVIGILECCKLEMYRRAVAVYEDRKCKENGDVFGEVEP